MIYVGMIAYQITCDDVAFVCTNYGSWCWYKAAPWHGTGTGLVTSASFMMDHESWITSPREVNSGWSEIARFHCPTFHWKGPRDFFCYEYVLPQWLLWELCNISSLWTPWHRLFHLLNTTICPDQPGCWDASSSPLQLPFNVWCTILSLGLRSARLKSPLWIITV